MNELFTKLKLHEINTKVIDILPDDANLACETISMICANVAISCDRTDDQIIDMIKKYLNALRKISMPGDRVIQ